jgi:small-conductance mechanosensitive channel
MSALLAATLMLAACGDDNAKPEAKTAEASTAQAEIVKYNQYVDAANSINQSFEETLDQYEQYMVPKLADKKPVKDYVIGNDIMVLRTKEKLEKALAMKPAIPEIDAAAKDFAQALGKLAPLSTDLQNYAAARPSCRTTARWRARKARPTWLR